MNDQRLEDALRDGPPFQTQYAMRALPLDQGPGAPVARTQPLLLVMAVAALLLVALVTALVIGALRPSALGLICDEAGSAASRTTEGWTLESGPIPPEDVRPGMLLTFDADSGGMALLDGWNGRLCSTLDGLAYFDTEDVAWSPTGDALAVIGTDAGEDLINKLAVISQAGVARYEFAPRPVSLAWAPDGQSIAVLVGSDAPFNRPTSVWIVPADGTAPRQMTIDCDRCIDEEGPLGWTHTIAWSPDGERLAISFTPAADPEAINEGDSDVLRLWAGSVASGRLNALTGIAEMQLLRWLDDDTLFTLDRSDPPRWLAVPVDHPENASEAAGPAPTGGLSPDGRHLVGTAGDGALLITELPSGDERLLVAAEPDRLLVPLMWAPDSQSVVFVKYDTGTSGQMLDGIWIVTLGGDVRLLTNQHGIPGPWQAVQD